MFKFDQPTGHRIYTRASSNNGTCVMKIAANGNEINTWCHAYNEGIGASDAKPVSDGFILCANKNGYRIS
jgi:hypothetical protein